MVVTHQAIQIHDEIGCSEELLTERNLRDAKSAEIYEDKSELQRPVSS
jgi:alkylation response protein AidB-like acyl-CoA dehydrogenase